MKHVGIDCKRIAIAERISAGRVKRKSIFMRMLDALHASRRLRRNVCIRRYRHLIDRRFPGRDAEHRASTLNTQKKAFEMPTEINRPSAPTIEPPERRTARPGQYA